MATRNVSRKRMVGCTATYLEISDCLKPVLLSCRRHQLGLHLPPTPYQPVLRLAHLLDVAAGIIETVSPGGSYDADGICR